MSVAPRSAFGAPSRGASPADRRTGSAATVWRAGAGRAARPACGCGTADVRCCCSRSRSGLAGFSPLEVWGVIVMGEFGDAFAWQNTLQRAAPLILTGSRWRCRRRPARDHRQRGRARARRVCGGGDRQRCWRRPRPADRRLAADGHRRRVGRQGVWIGIVGWLREKREVNRDDRPLLMSFIAIALFNQCVETVLRDPASLEQAVDQTPAETLMPRRAGLRRALGSGARHRAARSPPGQ